MYAEKNQEDRFEAAVAQKSPQSRVKVSPSLAKMLVELDDTGSGTIYVIRSPMAGTEYASEIRGEKTLYSVKLVEGIGVTADEEMAIRICREFPDYTYSAA